MMEIKQNKQREKQMEKTNLDSLNELLGAVRASQFIVGSFSADKGLSFSANPVFHNSPTTARTECKRLASIYPGKAFIFVKVAGAELIPTVQSISI